MLWAIKIGLNALGVPNTLIAKVLLLFLLVKAQSTEAAALELSLALSLLRMAALISNDIEVFKLPIAVLNLLVISTVILSADIADYVPEAAAAIAFEIIVLVLNDRPLPRQLASPLTVAIPVCLPVLTPFL